MKTKRERLEAGETFVTSEKGNSMTPLLKSGENHTLEPCTLEEVKKGDIVYCKVRGNFYTHLAKAISHNRGVLIGNNHGRTNGWTKQVFGRVKRNKE